MSQIRPAAFQAALVLGGSAPCALRSRSATAYAETYTIFCDRPLRGEYLRNILSNPDRAGALYARITTLSDALCGSAMNSASFAKRHQECPGQSRAPDPLSNACGICKVEPETADWRARRGGRGVAATNMRGGGIRVETTTFRSGSCSTPAHTKVNCAQFDNELILDAGRGMAR